MGNSIQHGSLGPDFFLSCLLRYFLEYYSLPSSLLHKDTAVVSFDSSVCGMFRDEITHSNYLQLVQRLSGIRLQATAGEVKFLNQNLAVWKGAVTVTATKVIPQYRTLLKDNKSVSYSGTSIKG